MIKKYFPYLALGPLANALWAWWALPQIGEEGDFLETIQWVAVQALLPLLFGILITFKRKYIFWLILAYGAYILLFAVGVLGWALMGTGTPVSIYVVCAMTLAMGFGLLYESMKDLNLGTKVRRYDIRDD